MRFDICLTVFKSLFLYSPIGQACIFGVLSFILTFSWANTLDFTDILFILSVMLVVYFHRRRKYKDTLFKEQERIKDVNTLKKSLMVEGCAYLTLLYTVVPFNY